MRDVGQPSRRPQNALRLLVVAAALGWVPSASSYPWPVTPFHEQHPIRGAINDPRQGGFHFGIDIVARDRAAVYAVSRGTALVSAARPRVVTLVSRWRGGSENSLIFGYWHIVPAVRNHERVEMGQVLGHLQRGHGHVHFAERLDGRYVNPLLPGHLEPFRFRRPPVDRTVAPDRSLSHHLTSDALSTDLAQASCGGIGVGTCVFTTRVMSPFRGPATERFVRIAIDN